MCGTASWQWEENPYAFEAMVETCHGCQKKDLLREDDEKIPAGASIVLVPEAEALRRYEALEG